MNFISKNDIFLLEEIVKRNFASKYKDSVLGILWSLLRPLLMMIILTIIFSTLFNNMIENYPVYLISGRCIYDFFSASINSGMMAIKGNKLILQKSATPKYIFVLGSVISEFINFFITVIILLGVMIVTNTTFYFTIMPLSIIPILSLVLMITGLCLILSIVCVYFTDIKHLWSAISLMWMYASAIFYPMDIIPEPYHQFLILNPLYWIIDQFRDLIYLGTLPEFSYIVNSLLLSSIILVVGVIIFKAFEKKTVLRL